MTGDRGQFMRYVANHAGSPTKAPATHIARLKSDQDHADHDAATAPFELGHVSSASSSTLNIAI
jgi:hypothetical protein